MGHELALEQRQRIEEQLRLTQLARALRPGAEPPDLAHARVRTTTGAWWRREGDPPWSAMNTPSLVPNPIRSASPRGNGAPRSQCMPWTWGSHGE